MPKYIQSAISKAQAESIARGDHTFTMPAPCAKGHISPRYASNAVCVTCCTNNNHHPKPKHERRMSIARDGTSVITIAQDGAAAALAAKASKRFAEITGRPVSRSVLHKAAIALLAVHLQGNLGASEVRALLH